MTDAYDQGRQAYYLYDEWDSQHGEWDDGWNEAEFDEEDAFIPVERADDFGGVE